MLLIAHAFRTAALLVRACTACPTLYTLRCSLTGTVQARQTLTADRINSRQDLNLLATGFQN